MGHVIQWRDPMASDRSGNATLGNLLAFRFTLLSMVLLTTLISLICSQPRLIAIFAFVLQVAPAIADDLIWIEGEDAVSHNMQRHGWYDSVKKNELSGQQWLSNFGDSQDPVASFEFEAEIAGGYVFWLRGNPVASKMSVRFNGGDWQPVNFDKAEQRLNLAIDSKPDLRFIAWVRFGEVSLKQGKNALEVRFESKNNRHGALDCFVLSRQSFFPQGSRKPGQKTGLADPGKWAFEPERDTFDSKSLLDLTYLNEKPAGKHGRVRRSSDGADFVDAAGKPIRFWAVNTTVQYRDDLKAVEEHARWLAKRGVNMVRHHGHLAPKEGGIDRVNQKDIDAAWRLVAAMKKHGIYVTLSPYWAVSVKYDSSWNIKDPGGRNLTGLLFFDEKLQAGYKNWLRRLMSPQNPYTGIPLAKDPSLAIFQIQNEDSLLFWTEQSIQGEQRIELAKHFGQWLKQKYGSVDSATKAWGGAASIEGDDLEAEIVMPQTIYHLTQTQRGAMEKRLNDQLQFYTETMAAFNADIAKFLTDELGYDGLINAGNWKTADQAKLLDAERFSYSVNDVIAVNRYYTGGHTNPTEGNKAGYLVSPGDTFTSESVLTRPADFPLALRQVHGHPMIISESAWVPPLSHQSEGPFLVAAYGAMTGFDVFYWFSTGDIGYGPPMGKWQLSTPSQLGMFPAAALMFRRGDVRKASRALLEYRPPKDLWSRRAPLLPEQAGFDPNRDERPAKGVTDAKRRGRITPLAYLAGPVEVVFGEGSTEVTDLTSLIDTSRQTVRSATGELTWNYGDGICTLNAPRTQGAAGALRKAGTIKLGAISIDCKNEYATILAISLDEHALETSSQVLIQVGTSSRPYGWKTSRAGGGKLRIESVGSSPWNIDKTRGTIRVRNRNLTAASLLDANGVPLDDVMLEKTESDVVLRLPENAMYVVLRSK
ncbi:MAG: hypothetical protein AAF802_05535 [Planctomycetota bacterium]